MLHNSDPLHLQYTYWNLFKHFPFLLIFTSLVLFSLIIWTTSVENGSSYLTFPYLARCHFSLFADSDRKHMMSHFILFFVMSDMFHKVVSISPNAHSIFFETSKHHLKHEYNLICPLMEVFQFFNVSIYLFFSTSPNCASRTAKKTQLMCPWTSE